jgi:hypothetical protein
MTDIGCSIEDRARVSGRPSLFVGSRALLLYRPCCNGAKSRALRYRLTVCLGAVSMYSALLGQEGKRGECKRLVPAFAGMSGVFFSARPVLL